MPVRVAGVVVVVVVVVGHLFGGAIKWSAIERGRDGEGLIDCFEAGGACVLACLEVMVLKWRSGAAGGDLIWPGSLGLEKRMA